MPERQSDLSDQEEALKELFLIREAHGCGIEVSGTEAYRIRFRCHV